MGIGVSRGDSDEFILARGCERGHPGDVGEKIGARAYR